MSADTGKPTSLPPPAVWLDGEPVALPEERAGTLPAICSELEALAADRQRVLAAVWVDGMPAELVANSTDAGRFHRVEAQSISLAELSRRLASQTRTEVRELRWSVEQAVLTVLINEPAANRRRWHEFHSALRDVLARLGMLRDLWGARLDELSTGGHALNAHLEELGHITSRIELLLLKPEADSLPTAMLLSNVFERNLAPWLRRLEDFLSDLHDQDLE